MSNFRQKQLSRRQVVGGIGAGLASLAASSGPALAQSARLGAVESTAEPVEDPTTKYPKPPFQPQDQPWPGLAGKMDPRPDHGEKSYKGSGRLLNRKVARLGPFQDAIHIGGRPPPEIQIVDAVREEPAALCVEVVGIDCRQPGGFDQIHH